MSSTVLSNVVVASFAVPVVKVPDVVPAEPNAASAFVMLASLIEESKTITARSIFPLFPVLSETVIEEIVGFVKSHEPPPERVGVAEVLTVFPEASSISSLFHKT